MMIALLKNNKIIEEKRTPTKKEGINTNLKKSIVI
jgi:hypothetical protein